MTYRIGLWIRNHLNQANEDYAYSMWKEYRRQTHLFKNTSYQSFRNYIYWLKKIGLIEVTKSEDSPKSHFKRVYYRISKKGVNADETDWAGPSRVLGRRRSPRTT